jgi:RNase P subunit RPR2
MAQNPLQQYFRQPKIFIGLPSKGIFNKVGATQGDVTHMPVYGMTGMDEIIMKTPDALMTGESTVKVIESCCPNIKDAWDLSALDNELVLAAIRIATYGNSISVTHKCTSCGEENSYDMDLSKLIEHYGNFKYENTVEVDGLVIKLKPLTYRESTTLSLKNYAIQKQLAQLNEVVDDEERQKHINSLYTQLSQLQNEIFIASIDTVETPTQAVTEREFIKDWVNNCDKEVFDAMKLRFNQMREGLKAPPVAVKCEECGAENEIRIELDESNFFVQA